MGLGDPFDVGYKAGQDKANAFPDAFKEVAGYAAKKQEEDKQRKMAFDMLKQFGMIDTKTEEPSLDQLTQGAKDFAKQQGHDLNINYGDNTEEAKKNLMGIYKALNIPLPQGKTTTNLNLTPGTKYDPIKGEVSFESPKSLLSQLGLSNIPDGMEVTGFDQKGQPMIRKIKVNVPEEKLKIEQEEKKKAQEEKAILVLDSAKDTLDTIGEVKKGINNFGLTGNLPSIPGTERVNWEANVNKLLSGKIIDVMTKMKEASKTGSTGFGQLSNKELEILKSASTALKRGMNAQEAQKYLDSMENAMQKVVAEKSSALNEDKAETKDQSQKNGDPLGLR